MLPEQTNFILGVGGQKCGTSWLASQLKQHPQFLMSPIKELHYWDRRFHPSFFGKSKMENKIIQQLKKTSKMASENPLIERYLMDRHENYYLTYFETRLEPFHRAFGEFSPSYCILTSEEFGYIRRFMPCRTKAIFIMREPVARLWSQCKMEHLKAQGRGNAFDPVQAFETRYDKPAFFKRSDYRNTIEALDKSFPEVDRHYIFFEELFSEDVLSGICSFIGISEFDFDISQNPNESLDLRKPSPNMWAQVRDYFAPIYRFVEDRMGYIPKKWKA